MAVCVVQPFHRGSTEQRIVSHMRNDTTVSYVVRTTYINVV